MRTLFLHIGHMKTGTTWLQRAFLESQAALAAAGICYPSWGHAGEAPNLDRLTPTGNFAGLLNARRRFLDQAKEVPASANLLVSGEPLFDILHGRPDLADDVEHLLSAGFDQIRVLLLVRDPIPLGASIWQQRIKGWQGETRSLDAYLDEGFDWPERACRVLDLLDACPQVEIALHNYSRVRDVLLAVAEAWLGIAPGVVRPPREDRLNRSLTAGEAALQLHLNRALARPTGKIFGFRLVHRLPDVPPDPPRPSREAAARMLNRQKPFIDRLDARLRPEERLSVDLSGTHGMPQASFVLGETQLAQIAAGIADWLAEGPETLTPPAPERPALETSPGGKPTPER
jgi:hypothetical protein